MVQGTLFCATLLRPLVGGPRPPRPRPPRPPRPDIVGRLRVVVCVCVCLCACVAAQRMADDVESPSPSRADRVGSSLDRSHSQLRLRPSKIQAGRFSLHASRSESEEKVSPAEQRRSLVQWQSLSGQPGMDGTPAWPQRPAENPFTTPPWPVLYPAARPFPGRIQ